MTSLMAYDDNYDHGCIAASSFPEPEEMTTKKTRKDIRIGLIKLGSNSWRVSTFHADKDHQYGTQGRTIYTQ